MVNPENERYFEFTWTIENFSMCRHKADEPLRSPKFMVHFLFGTEWYLQLFPMGINDAKTIMCFLHRTEVGRESVSIKYSISVEESNCEVQQTFKKGSASEKMVKIDMARYYRKLQESEKEGDLKVVCRLMKGWNMVEDPGVIRPYPLCCSARSQVPVEKRKMSWSIKNFTTLPSQHEVSTSVVSASPTSPKLLVTLSWSDENQKRGGRLKMEVREMPDLLGKTFQLGCRVHLLNANDQRRKLFSGWYLFTFYEKRSYLLWISTYSDSVWNFELDIDRAELASDFLLLNRELVLECDFAISCDPLAYLVEYTGFVHSKPKLPPQDIGIQVTPSGINWKDILLTEFYEFFLVLNSVFNNRTFIFFFMLIVFFSVVSRINQYSFEFSLM